MIKLHDLTPSRFAGIPCAFAALLLAACGGGGDDGSVPPQSVPQELQGTWNASVQSCPCGPATLTIGSASYQVVGPLGPDSVVTASIAMETAHEVTFSNNQSCPGSGTYAWVISGTKLTFTAKPGTEDACARRTAILVGQVWTSVR